MDSPSTSARPRPCRVVIRGRISDRLGGAFPEMTLERRPGRTVLAGRIGRASLDALLDRLRDLGLEPLGVEVQDGAKAPPAACDAEVVAALRAGDEAAFVAL